MLDLAVWYESANERMHAESLAEAFHLPVHDQAQILVWVSEAGLGLKMSGASPVRPDFSMEIWAKRRKEGKQQGLIKACNPTPDLRILDLTAGWGRDAAILSSFGAEIVMLERNPLMAALLADALERQDSVSKAHMKLSLIHTDALTYLQNPATDNFPVIYMDPMHPARQKSALVKKDLQMLQRLIGPDEDAYSVLEAAIQKATEKVVVKWPQSQKALMPAHNSIPGKTVRFDRYAGLGRV